MRSQRRRMVKYRMEMGRKMRRARRRSTAGFTRGVVGGGG